MPQYETIDEFLARARVAIDNAQANAEIQGSLTAFGYTPEKMLEGRGLYDRAQAATQQQITEYGEQIGATAALNEAMQQAKKTYNPLAQVARVAFKKEPGIATQLAIAGARKRTLSGWLEQAKVFYDNALSNADIGSKLGEFGITQEKLQGGKAEVEAIEGLNAAQEEEKGEAQQATYTRDVAIDVLSDWLEDFLDIAEVALSDRPQLLEALGVVVPS